MGLMSDSVSTAASSASSSEPAAMLAAKVSPPIIVTGANLAGLSLPDLVQIATLVYIGVMTAHKIAQIWFEWRAMRRAESAGLARSAAGPSTVSPGLAAHPAGAVVIRTPKDR
jgi:hypothetical protein